MIGNGDKVVDDGDARSGRVAVRGKRAGTKGNGMPATRGQNAAWRV